MIKVKNFKKLRGNSKKYEITFEKNGKTYTRKFGAAGMSDYTIHKDKERRERYISRHKKDLRTGDPMKPGYLSMYILWNKPTLKASLADYKRRLNVYNRTGKFPTGISGSKKLSFGVTLSNTSLSNLPDDIQDIIKRQSAAMTIQDVGKKMNSKQSLLDSLKIRAYTRYKSAATRTDNPRENIDLIKQLWRNLDPEDEFGSKWLNRAGKVLVKSDFDFKTRNFWWKIVENILAVMDEMNEEESPLYYLSGREKDYYEISVNAINNILNKTGYDTSAIKLTSVFWARRALEWWRSKRTNTFGKKIYTNYK